MQLLTMASERMSGDPAAEPHQEHSRASSVRVKLKALAQAKTLQAFAKAAVWGCNKQHYISTISEGNFSNTSHTKLLGYCYSAISNGLKQLHTSWPQGYENAAYYPHHHEFLVSLRTITVLCTDLAMCKSARWYNTAHTDGEPGIAEKAGESAGVIPTTTET